jgi:hypothetical protein
MTKIGRLAADPSGLYSSLEIHVYRREHKLQLIGLRGTKEKVLFEAGVGLGSGEYPTPGGRFFITIIYDDHPWWIPPDRDWAWGQSPSRTVYGGHMMPLMSKREMRGSGADDEEFDAVAPKVQIIDSGGYRVHGTDSPWSVGGNQSHGCVRMKNATVKELADKLRMYVGVTGGRSRSANGEYVTLAKPVRITLH